MFSQRLLRASRRLSQPACNRRWNTPIGASLRPRYASGAQEASQAEAPSRASSSSIAPKAKDQSSGNAARIVLYSVFFTVLGAVGSWQILKQYGMRFYSDKESLTRFSAVEAGEDAQRIEDAINKHPFVQELRSKPELVESRPHMRMPVSYRQHSLTGSTLRGPKTMPIPPIAWFEDGKSIVGISYAGEGLCGHPGIIHGGFLATLLDEGLAWCCIGALPHGTAVTANLNINYRKPARAGNFLVLRAETTKVEGRKAWVKGHIELLTPPGEEPTILAEATGLFISPKYAAMMPRIR